MDLLVLVTITTIAYKSFEINLICAYVVMFKDMKRIINSIVKIVLLMHDIVLTNNQFLMLLMFF